MIHLQRFLSDNWMIRRTDFEHVSALIIPCIIAGNPAAASAELVKPKSTASATATPYLAKWYELDELLPADSVAVIRLKGVLYSWETEWFIKTFKAAAANPNIVGIVIEIDGPGGMVSHIDQAVAAIEKCEKPTATVVTGVMASAHLWLGISSDRTFIASPMCEIGSVGTMFTHVSYKDFFAQAGIKYWQIYPDSADLKNKEIRALEDNADDSIIKEHAARLHRIFAESVAKHIGIDYDPELPLFRGEMYDAAEAVKLGYIDSFGDLGDAVRYVLGTATGRKANQ